MGYEYKRLAFFRILNIKGSMLIIFNMLPCFMVKFFASSVTITVLLAWFPLTTYPNAD